MENEKGLVERENLKAIKNIEKEIIPFTTLQQEMDKLIPYAGTIEIEEKQKHILFAPVKEEDIEIRPDGLVYLPWMEYVSRLRDAFGMAWSIIPRDMPKLQGNHIYWGFYLMIQGKLAGFAIGEQQYIPTNPTMTYGDAIEGAKSNALMRLCKGLGISLELWKPSFVRSWKEKYGESYPAIWPDGKPKLDKNGKQKTEWRKKGQIINGNQEIIDVIPEVIMPIVETKSQEDIDREMELFKKESEKKFAEYHDRMMKIENLFELKAYYKKHFHDMEKELLPEHMQTITHLKNSLKEKFENEEKSKNQ